MIALRSRRAPSMPTALVLLLGNVSHNAAIKVRNVARRRGTPLASLTSPSVSGVRRTITELAARAG